MDGAESMEVQGLGVGVRGHLEKITDLSIEAWIRGHSHSGEKWMNAYTSLSKISLQKAWLFILFQSNIF